jgi:hypothetical protein
MYGKIDVNLLDWEKDELVNSELLNVWQNCCENLDRENANSQMYGKLMEI